MFWEWVAFFRISPWGDSWRRSGRLATVFAAAMGAKVNDHLEDKFMPGGGKFRGMNDSEIEMLEQLKKIDVFREQIERRR